MGIITPHRLKTIKDQRLAQLKELKSHNEKLIGYLCIYVPVEIIHAAGAVPIRLARADYQSSLRGEVLLRVDACPFCKTVLGQFDSDPLYQLLDGIIFVNTCDMMRRLPELVATKINIPVFQLYMPRTSQPVPARITEYARQLHRLSQFLTGLTGIKPQEEKLINAIGVYNQLRAKLRTLELLRAQPNSPMKTAEFFDLIALSTILDPAETIRLIYEISQEASELTPPSRIRPRLLLAGSIVAESDRDRLNLIEHQAAIVADVVCTGARFVEGEIEPDQDPIFSLARYYFNRIPCAYRRPNDRLYQHIRNLIDQRQIQGIVYQPLLYCDPWRFEAQNLRAYTKLPILELDHDYSRQNYEQVRTRIEAFVELLRDMTK